MIFAGHRPVEEIWASNHVLVMPSRAEGFPLAIVEAMLCARPVLASDVAGNSEIVEGSRLLLRHCFHSLPLVAYT